MTLPSKKKEKCKGKTDFNGKATLSVTVSDCEQETSLRMVLYCKNGSVMWNNVAIRFHISLLHKCNFCTKHKKLHQGHHVDWCLLAAKPTAVDYCSSDNANSNNAKSINDITAKPAYSNSIPKENNYT